MSKVPTMQVSGPEFRSLEPCKKTRDGSMLPGMPETGRALKLTDQPGVTKLD